MAQSTITISAATADGVRGQINLTWLLGTDPCVDRFKYAHCEIYESSSNSFAGASKIKDKKGFSFARKLDASGLTRYYWFIPVDEGGNKGARYPSGGGVSATTLVHQPDNGTVDTDQLANGAVTENKHGDGSVTTSKLGANSVINGKVVDLTLTKDKINNNEISEFASAYSAGNTANLSSGVTEVQDLTVAPGSTGKVEFFTSGRIYYRQTGGDPSAWVQFEIGLYEGSTRLRFMTVEVDDEWAEGATWAFGYTDNNPPSGSTNYYIKIDGVNGIGGLNFAAFRARERYLSAKVLSK